MSNVRTRFAPSPTGYLHVGAIRTALYGWLVARQNNGQFILRIEDTDKAREVDDAENHIKESLKALGLNYDEGPDIEGSYGPYRQSDRLDIYKEWAEKLISIGRAYADPYSAEELDELRTKAKLAKKAFLFRDYRPEDPPTWDGSQPLRFKSEPKRYSWNDLVLGDLTAGEEVVDDFIIMKSDGYPTYNFAHIVDDELMKISHIIRGHEFISSIPRYLNLYEALELTPPIFATPPPVLGPDGKKKLSKRDGAKDVLDYLREGYLVEALINFIASLGWSDGTTQEIFSIEELISKFKLENVQKSGSNFDEQRLLWVNGHHIRDLSLDDLYSKTVNFWPESSNGYDDEYKKEVLSLIQERLKYLGEIPALSEYFFKDLDIDPSLIRDNKKLGEIDRNQLTTWLELAKETLENSDFSVNDIGERLNSLLQTTGQKPAIIFSLIRIATTQSPFSPGLFETLNVLGKETTFRRINAQISAL